MINYLIIDKVLEASKTLPTQCLGACLFFQVDAVKIYLISSFLFKAHFLKNKNKYINVNA